MGSWWLSFCGGYVGAHRRWADADGTQFGDSGWLSVFRVCFGFRNFMIFGFRNFMVVNKIIIKNACDLCTQRELRRRHMVRCHYFSGVEPNSWWGGFAVDSSQLAGLARPLPGRMRSLGTSIV